METRSADTRNELDLELQPIRKGGSLPFTLAIPSRAPGVLVLDASLAENRAREQKFFGGLTPGQSMGTTSPTGTSHSTAVASTSYCQGVADDTTTDYESDAVVDQTSDD